MDMVCATMNTVIDMKRYEEEYVDINGICQYFLHYPSTERNRDVLVYLHGGPGSSSSNFAYLLDEQWNDLYNVVYYDQRGAGRTFLKNKKVVASFEDLLADLKETILYLRSKYDVDKVVLFGHSWGTVLGSFFIQRHPELVYYYLGLGQVVDMVENEKTGYQKLRKAIVASGNAGDLRQLEAVGSYPNTFDIRSFAKQCRVVRKLQGKYGLALKINSELVRMYIKSPVFKLRDLYAMSASGSVNEKLLESLFKESLYDLSHDYKMPVYYLLGENDFQTPYTIAESFFETITAPDKETFRIVDGGHAANLDQPERCRKIYQEIVERNKRAFL